MNHQVIKLIPSKHVQNIYQHSTARGDEHDIAMYFILITDDSLDGNEQQYSTNQMDSTEKRPPDIFVENAGGV